MKIFAAILAISVLGARCTGQAPELMEGDLIFHESRSPQGRALSLATGSRYTHMGIIFRSGGKFYVYEAVQPVKFTPLDEWIRRGRGGHYIVKRLKNAGRILTPEAIAKMKKAGRSFSGKNYDSLFQWDDSRIYCSELVWKIYKRALNIEIGSPKKFREFSLNHGEVRELIRKRYGSRIDLDEPVISPAGMFESDLLVTVRSD